MAETRKGRRGRCTRTHENESVAAHLARLTCSESKEGMSRTTKSRQQRR